MRTRENRAVLKTRRVNPDHLLRVARNVAISMKDLTAGNMELQRVPLYPKAFLPS